MMRNASSRYTGVNKLPRNNEVLTQIIAVHSLFKSFQNTAINDTSPLLSSWRYGKFCGSCKQRRAIWYANCQNLFFFGMIFNS